MKSHRLSVVFVLLLIALVVDASGSVLVTDRGAELRDQHLEWLGGRALLEAVVDITFKGTLTMSGMEGALTVEQKRGGYQRGTFDFGMMSGCEIMTPTGGWMAMNGGEPDKLSTERNAEGMRAIAQTFNDGLLNDTPEYLGVRAREGVDYEVIGFADGEGHRRNLYLDDADGLLAWVESVEGGKSKWTQQEDFRLVEGMRQPFKMTSYTVDGAVESVIEWKSIEFNRGLSADDFKPVATGKKLVTLVAGGEAGASEWTAFSWYFERYIYVPCVVNGVATELLLDSGAGITVLDTAFAAEAGVVGHTEIRAQGVGGSQKAYLASGVNIDVAGLELRDLTVAIIDLSEVSAALGRSMPVVLGKEVFSSMVVDIDYPNARLTFRDQASFDFEESGHSLDLYPAGQGHRLVKASVNGREPVKFQIDTGSGSSVDIFDWYATQEDLLSEVELVSTGMGGGVGGVMEFQVASMASFEFAGYELRNVPAGFPPTGSGVYGTAEFAGNLGAGIFGRFRLIFDYSREKLHVIAGPEWDTKLFRRNRIGLNLKVVDGEMEVLHVAKGSPAEAAGIEAGDVLLTVNGKAITEETTGGRLYWLNQREVGTELVFGLKSGVRRVVVMAEYY